MNKENCTKGPIAVDRLHNPPNAKDRRSGYVVNGPIRGLDPDSGLPGLEVRVCDLRASGNMGIVEVHANAELIAEAFNVLHETGMTPRELAEHKVELLRILNMAVNCLRVCHQELHEAGCNEAADDTHNDILVYMDTLVKYQPVTPA